MLSMVSCNIAMETEGAVLGVWRIFGFVLVFLWAGFGFFCGLFFVWFFFNARLKDECFPSPGLLPHWNF